MATINNFDMSQLTLVGDMPSPLASGDSDEKILLYSSPFGQVKKWPNGTLQFQNPEDPKTQISLLPNQSGGYEVKQWKLGQGNFLSDLKENVLGDQKLMAFLAIAGGGAAASAALGGGAAAGGAAGGVGSTAGGLGSASAGSGVLGTGLTGTQALGAAGTASSLAGLGSSPSTANDAWDFGGGGAGVTGVPQSTATGLSDIARMAASAGQTVADFVKANPGLVGAGLGALAGAASGNVDMTTERGLVDYAKPAGQAYAGMAQDTINGKFIGQGLGTNPYAGQNPYLGKAMDDVASRMTDAYRTGTAAQTMSQFQQAGAFGGSAMRQYQESQNRAFSDSLGSTLNNMSMQDYAAQQGLAENQLNRQLSQFQGERGNMMNAAAGLTNLGGTQTQQGVGPIQGAIGGAIGGYGLGTAWGSQQSAPQVTGTLGAQPITTGVQMPQNAVQYNQPTMRVQGQAGLFPGQIKGY